jgi:non-heme chloroperoxidase
MLAGPISIRFEVEDLTLVGDVWRRKPTYGTVVLLQGGGQLRQSWTRTASYVHAAGWNVVTFDARGHGDSGWSASGDYSLDAFIGDIAAVASALPQQPVLVGASLGGMAALIAQGERRLGRALVLADIVISPEVNGIARIASLVADAPERFPSLDEAATYLGGPRSTGRSSAGAAGLSHMFTQGPDGWWRWRIDRQITDVVQGLDPDRARRAAQAVHVPTLLVRGSNSDVVSEDGTTEFLQAIPHAHHVRVLGAGHLIVTEANDVFCEQLACFLSRLEPSAGGHTH